MVDARDVLLKDSKIYRHSVKQEVKAALAAYDRWNIAMQRILKDRYQLWLDISDAVDSDLRRHVEVLYYSIDNFFLKKQVPKSKLFSRMETALVLLNIATEIFKSIFRNVRKQIGVDVAPLFAGADASDIYSHWSKAIDAAWRQFPDFPNVNVNDDADSVRAVGNISKFLSSKDTYNKAGEYALKLNPDQWRHLEKEDRLRLKQGIPFPEE